MAMVKSAVAMLIHEGHRGPELLKRLNRFMLEQPRRHRMVTLTIADLDANKEMVEITNAAHPPVLIAGGDVREILLPALPVGFPWRDSLSQQSQHDLWIAEQQTGRIRVERLSAA